jgi:hypothetical protein
MTDKKIERKTANKRRAMFVYVVILHLVAIILIFTLWSTKGTVSNSQAKNIAYGFALKECYAQHNPGLDCSSIEIEQPHTFCFDWMCTDTPLWIVDYKTTKGGTSFAGTINLDKSGKYQSPADMEKNFDAKVVIPDN